MRAEANFQAKYRFGRGGSVTFHIKPADLRLDFIQEAVRQGVDVAKAKNVADTTIFTFTRRQYRREYVRQGKTFPRRLLRRLVPHEKRYGGMDKFGGAQYFFIDVKRIVKASKKRKYQERNFRKSDTLKQNLSLFWTHERQHLIQVARDGKFTDSHKNKVKVGLLFTSSVGLLNLCLGTPYVFTSPTLSEASKRLIPVLLVGFGSWIAQRMIIKHRNLHSASEEEAYRKESSVAKLPFQVKVEGDDWNYRKSRNLRRTYTPWR